MDDGDEKKKRVAGGYKKYPERADEVRSSSVLVYCRPKMPQLQARQDDENGHGWGAGVCVSSVNRKPMRSMAKWRNGQPTPSKPLQALPGAATTSERSANSAKE